MILKWIFEELQMDVQTLPELRNFMLRNLIKRKTCNFIFWNALWIFGCGRESARRRKWRNIVAGRL